MLTVFYEDRRGQRGDFGFHRFVCQAVIDRTGMTDSVFHVERNRIQGIPLKGAGNVFKRCKRDLPRLANRVRKVFAVYDQDKLNKLLKLHGVQCRPTLVECLVEPCEPHEALEVVLIKQNIETVIRGIRDSGIASFIDAKVFEGALSKTHLTRDSVFNQCALHTSTEVRNQLLQLDSLRDADRLVSKLVEAVQDLNPNQSSGSSDSNQA